MLSNEFPQKNPSPIYGRRILLTGNNAHKAMKNKRCTHIAYQSLCPSPFGIKAELIFSTFTFKGAVPKIQPVC
ncbi:hypothetical protein BpOF4_15595 [Alkalihalophilus pseudofirmus OF4]|uniref:Uncharacterized protein n=1 Tax=Alkalihalophilus pseudofirmus (strain ATCC BAA-2126 / JCM 17055 / OF4) TaxID=398511 RepID=D3G0K6_ALKPO|nr:hypothetical protein BpOF4_15595 [Alkalihalophilus pseudofirmus OF4]